MEEFRIAMALRRYDIAQAIIEAMRKRKAEVFGD